VGLRATLGLNCCADAGDARAVQRTSGTPDGSKTRIIRSSLSEPPASDRGCHSYTVRQPIGKLAYSGPHPTVRAGVKKAPSLLFIPSNSYGYERVLKYAP
jgi:hypothetical protein